MEPNKDLLSQIQTIFESAENTRHIKDVFSDIFLNHCERLADEHLSDSKRDDYRLTHDKIQHMLKIIEKSY